MPKPKVMVVSYNRIIGLPDGRSEAKNAIAYSAVAYSLDNNWKSDYWMAFACAFASVSKEYFSCTNATPEQEAVAKKVLTRLMEALLEDLKIVEIVYVYVGGENATPDGLKFVRKLHELGKKVHMVTCYCENTMKVEFAKELGIDIIWTNCSDTKGCCKKIFEQYSKPPRRNRRR